MVLVPMWYLDRVQLKQKNNEFKIASDLFPLTSPAHGFKDLNYE
jgi:hypothetical protein